MKPRTWIVVGALAISAVIFWVARPDRHSETSSSKIDSAVASTHVSAAAPLSVQVTPTQADSSSPTPVVKGGAEEALAHYPVDLSELRARLPDNRYWELGAPTRDPEVARARAERAKRTNEAFGRTQTGEATEPEIRAYYAEQRRISEDYLQLSLLVLAEKGDQIPERDRGLFELSAKLHRERLTQIERDLAGALARRRARAQ